MGICNSQRDTRFVRCLAVRSAGIAAACVAISLGDVAGAGQGDWPRYESAALKRMSEIASVSEREKLADDLVVRVLHTYPSEFTPVTVGALQQVLTDPDPNVRCSVAAALGFMGPKAERALPALLAGYHAERTSEKARLAGEPIAFASPINFSDAYRMAIIRIHSGRAHISEPDIDIPPQACPCHAGVDAALLNLTRESDPAARERSVTILAETVLAEGPLGWTDGQIENIAALLDDRDDKVRIQAAKALGYIGPPARSAVQKLKALSVGHSSHGHGEDPFLSSQAAEEWALQRISSPE
jgi:HEAT repeat protein